MRKGRNKRVIDEYMENNFDGLASSCEVLPVLSDSDFNEMRTNRTESFSVCEIHHIAKYGSVRWDENCNIIILSKQIHAWVEEHVKAGRVLCLWVKWKAGQCDMNRMSEITGRKFPSVLDCDDQREACEEFPFIEKMRKELLEEFSTI